MTEENHELRELKFKLKTLAKQNGLQGNTIHRLRAELAEVRELNSKIERGELRRLERQAPLLHEHIKRLLDEIERLREKLNHVDHVHVQVDAESTS